MKRLILTVLLQNWHLLVNSVTTMKHHVNKRVERTGDYTVYIISLSVCEIIHIIYNICGTLLTLLCVCVLKYLEPWWVTLSPNSPHHVKLRN
jgi:hypothetical protein